MPEKFYAQLQLLDHYYNGEREIRLLKHLCDPKRISLDIGANIGTYAYFMSRHSLQVYAFEPNLELAIRLRRVYPSIVTYQVAVSNEAGWLQLNVPIRDGRTQHELGSVARLFETDARVEKYRVPSIRIDDEEYGDVGFIKIDVEQHELAVISGALKTIGRCQPIIMTEVTPLLYPRPLPEMFIDLSKLGYTGWFQFMGEYHPFTEYSKEVHANEAKWGGYFMGNNVIFLPSTRDATFLFRN